MGVLKRLLACAVALAVASASATAHAQQTDEATRAQPAEHRAADLAQLLAGAALAFGLHEGSHLALDVAFGADPLVRRVDFGPLPFFAIVPRAALSPRRAFAVSSAGFWMQGGLDEWLLTRRPGIRHEHAPLAKGILAFNVLTAIGYAAVAMARVGPVERDTRGMALAIDVDERVIGLVVVAPAVPDVVRYLRPDAAWAKWASRITKATSVAMIVK